MSRLGRTYAARPLIQRQSIASAPPVDVGLGIALETDTAFPLGGSQSFTLGLALETDTAFPLTGSRDVSIGLAVETDAAFPLAGTHTARLGLALESDIAFPLTGSQDFTIALAVETDTAFDVTPNTGVQFIIYEVDIVSLEPIALPASIIPTPQSVELVAAFNWTPLTDIAGSVTGPTREALSGTGRVVRVQSAAIAGRQLPAKIYRLNSLYRFESDAQSRANLLMRWLEGKLKAYRLTINRFRNQVELGIVGRIDYYPRFGLETGFTGVVVAWSEMPAKGQVTIVLMGPAP